MHAWCILFHCIALIFFVHGVFLWLVVRLDRFLMAPSKRNPHKLNLLLPHPLPLLLRLIFIVICHHMTIWYILICLAIIFMLTLTPNVVSIVSVRLDCLSLSTLVCLAFSNLGSGSHFAPVFLKLQTSSFLSFSPTLLMLTLPLFHLESIFEVCGTISLRM
jgi:hypothetical protein